MVALRKEEVFQTLKAKIESRNPPTEFLPGTKILLKRLYTPKNQCPSLNQPYDGPYSILSKIDNVSYIIELPDGQQKQVPINRLKLFVPDTKPDPEFKAKYHSFLRQSSIPSLAR